MTTIRLTNSMTRKKEEFIPLNPDNVRMYVCGPTVYDRAHLGNARPVVVFDVLGREVLTLVDGEQKAGRYDLRFNARHLASGVYIYRIKAGAYTQVHKMVLLR